ncbi:aspartokinase, partial [Salinibacter ruber]|nr:aspartokinase [Salinibacter ruber]
MSSRARWDTIVEVVRTHRAEGRAPFLVCSALQGISDQLEALCAQLASAEPGAPESTLDTIRERHRALGQDLGVEAEAVQGYRICGRRHLGYRGSLLSIPDVCAYACQFA